jgi:dTDP-L-rhamnose 4-epimerase
MCIAFRPLLLASRAGGTGVVTKRVRITEGAGVIGSQGADERLARGDRVRVLDALVPQLHGQREP